MRSSDEEARVQKYDSNPMNSFATPCGTAADGSRWTAVEKMYRPRRSTVSLQLQHGRRQQAINRVTFSKRRCQLRASMPLSCQL